MAGARTKFPTRGGPTRHDVLEHAADGDARPVLDGVDAERGAGEDLGCLGGGGVQGANRGGDGELAPRADP